MLKRFVRRFGRSVHKSNLQWYNSRLECVLYALVILTVAVFFGRGAFTTVNTPLAPESFTLRYAQEHRNYKRKAPDDYELRMYSADEKVYIVSDDNIRQREIREFLEILQPGMQIDVLVGSDGVRQLTADGMVLLSKEVTAARAMTAATMIMAFVGALAILEIFLWIRIVALHVKKRKGWNF